MRGGYNRRTSTKPGCSSANFRSELSSSGFPRNEDRGRADDRHRPGNASGLVDHGAGQMRRRGADCPVVVMKRGNARGAKGAGHRRRTWHKPGQTGRSPKVQRKAAAFVRCHEPDDARVSSGICEGLGVKFPGPTPHASLTAIPGPTSSGAGARDDQVPTESVFIDVQKGPLA
jgi:hypothetical protein